MIFEENFKENFDELFMKHFKEHLAKHFTEHFKNHFKEHSKEHINKQQLWSIPPKEVLLRLSGDTWHSLLIADKHFCLHFDQSSNSESPKYELLSKQQCFTSFYGYKVLEWVLWRLIQ